MKHKSFAELQKDLEKAQKEIVIGGIYSHYKHPENIYKVYSLAVQEATNKICVIYEPLYHPGMLFIRDVENWLTKPIVNKKEVQRFTLQK